MIDDDRRNLAEEAADRRAHLAARKRAWVPDRREGETDSDYWRRYTSAEFVAHLNGLHRGRATYTDGFGDQQWADPMGGRFS